VSCVSAFRLWFCRVQFWQRTWSVLLKQSQSCCALVNAEEGNMCALYGCQSKTLSLWKIRQQSWWIAIDFLDRQRREMSTTQKIPKMTIHLEKFIPFSYTEPVSVINWRNPAFQAHLKPNWQLKSTWMQTTCWKNASFKAVPSTVLFQRLSNPTTIKETNENLPAHNELQTLPPIPQTCKNDQPQHRVWVSQWQKSCPNIRSDHRCWQMQCLPSMCLSGHHMRTNKKRLFPFCHQSNALRKQFQQCALISHSLLFVINLALTDQVVLFLTRHSLHLCWFINFMFFSLFGGGAGCNFDECETRSGHLCWRSSEFNMVSPLGNLVLLLQMSHGIQKPGSYGLSPSKIGHLVQCEVKFYFTHNMKSSAFQQRPSKLIFSYAVGEWQGKPRKGDRP